MMATSSGRALGALLALLAILCKASEIHNSVQDLSGATELDSVAFDRAVKTTMH